jgi:maleate isomerase
MKPFRVGLIVPSFDTTTETEVPTMLRRREIVRPERFTVHSSRVPMLRLTREELARADAESERSAAELADARCDVVVYASSAAVIARGHGAHVVAQDRLVEATSRHGSAVPVVTSAGAIVAGIHALGVRRIAMITPYVESLTRMTVAYLRSCGIEVVDAISLEITDGLALGRFDPTDLVHLAGQLRLAHVEAVVLSACEALPSLEVIPEVERRTGLPVVTAAAAVVRQLLEYLGLEPIVPGAGALLGREVSREWSCATLSAGVGRAGGQRT